MPLDKRSNKRLSVYFIVPAPTGISPGQRFRFEHYLSFLKESNIKFRISSFYSLSAWQILYTPGNKTKKVFCVAKGFFRRIMDLIRIRKYSYIYLYREAAPIGPPVFEWFISKVLRKKIIYDFDDAIWIPVTSSYNKSSSRLKNFSKIAKICKWSYKVSVGNQYLADFAGRYNSNTVIIPTVVNTVTIHNKLQHQDTDTPAIGWTGTFSTLVYLDMVLPVLKDLQEKYNFRFVVIADKDPGLALKNYRFIKWNGETEVNDLLSFHIGLMPLYDDEISKGKCGFKAIQYMALGIPAVVSPVGVNSKIVEDRVYRLCLCYGGRMERPPGAFTEQPTATNLVMGAAARTKIENYYSVTSSNSLFIQLFS